MAGPTKSSYSDSWVGEENTEIVHASKKSETNVEKHSFKKVQEHKQRKLRRRSESFMEENAMELQEHPSAAPSQARELDTRIPAALERKPQTMQIDHHNTQKEISNVELGLKTAASHKKSRNNKSKLSKRNPTLLLKDSGRSKQNSNNESQNLRKSYLGLIEDMPVKIITEDEWKGAGANSTIPSSVARPAVKIFALSNGSYNEVPSLVVLNEASKDFPAGDNFPNPVAGADFGNDTPLQLAIMMQKGCQVIYSMCHGFLGGIALAYALLIFCIGTSFDNIGGFFQVNPEFATCVQTSFGFLLSVCLVSVLDKYDIGSWKGSSVRHVVESKSRLIGMVILMIYSTTLVLNTCSAPWDENLGLPPYNNSFWLSPETAEREINQWTTLSLFRCTGAILGWIFISLFPKKDLLHASLNAIYRTRDESSAREDISMPSVQKY